MFPKLNPKMYGLKDSRDPDYGTPDGYRYFLDLGPLSSVAKLLKDVDPFWADQTAHGDYDSFCEARDVRPHIKDIKPAGPSGASTRKAGESREHLRSGTGRPGVV